MPSPMNPVAPPSYQMSLEGEFDQKSSSAILLSSSTAYEVDEDGWPIYDPAAFEAVTESNGERSPPASSSAGFLGGDTSGHERQGRPPHLKVLPSTRPMKSKSSERRRRNPRSDHDFSSEPRVVTPPPPFTATGPSLDGPPFEDVVRLSYDRPDSRAASPIEPSYPPLTRSPPPSQTLLPVEPLRLPPHRLTSSNPHPSRRSSPLPPNIPPRSNFATITRVEFDPQMAYSQYGGRTGNHTSMQVGATAFYNHAVASQLSTNRAGISPTQLGHMDHMDSRVSLPYSTGYSPTTSPGQPATSLISPHEQYPSSLPSFRFSTPGAPAPLPHQFPSPPLPSSPEYIRPQSGTARGPLPPVPPSNVPLSQPRWAGSDAQLV